MKINANAKINLSLDVCSKREDGYHNVEMVMQEISLCDIVEIDLNSDGEIRLQCDEAILGDPSSTLTYKAAKLFFDEAKIDSGCDIRLNQNIPVCSGLGGGSADAAAVLNGLNSLCGEPFSQEKLCALGLKIGADVPFCVMGGTALAQGIGEILTPVKTKMKKWVALIKPGIDISTPEAYKKMDSRSFPHPDTKSVCEALVNNDIDALKKSSFNCFEYVMADEYPQIEEIKQHFYDCGALFAMMSGSGPTVFGLFESYEDAAMAFENYKKPFSGGGVGEFVIR